MKRLGSILAVASLIFFSAQPAWAWTCPKLIKQGREQLAKAKLAKPDADKIKALLDEAEKLHDDGDHNASIKKSNEALSLLKKK